MTNTSHFDVIIIGGSYSGLSAAMSLGRAMRNVLVIDSNQPCNRQTPHSHNFITQDGQTPAAIAQLAREQVEKYPTIRFYSGLAVAGERLENDFVIATENGDRFTAKKLLFATGIRDVFPEIAGFAESWGISVIHCPYCHGYEVRSEPTAILGNGEYGFEFGKMISNWTSDLTLLTNGTSTLKSADAELLQKRGITIVETEVDRFGHENGTVRKIFLKDGTELSVKALYAKPAFVQHCDIPEGLGCELTEHGYIRVSETGKTTVDGIYACGDNSNAIRAVSIAVASGTMVGATINRELTGETFL
jgi:thioredoxin reductase